MLGYDRAITVFSPQGRLYQVEYAREAVKKGTVSLGIVYKDGVLLAADKNITEGLMVSDSVEKIYQIDEHLGAATSGLVADGRRMIDKARVVAQSYRITYDEPVTVDKLTKELCDYQQLHTQIAGVRPFGTALLIAGTGSTPKLFETDPSGSYWEYKATAIGENTDAVRDIFNKEYKEDMSLDDAVNLALRALYKGTNERFNERSIEISAISKGKFKKLSEEAVKKHILKAIEDVKKGK
jgi:proteasome alpha subunit